MNLYDIVKRNDRCLSVLKGSVQFVHRASGPHPYFGVKLAADTTIRLRSAHEFTCLETFPRDLNWSFGSVPDEPQPEAAWLAILAVECGDEKTLGRKPLKETLYLGTPGHGGVELTWPAWCGHCDGFDIEIGNPGKSPVELKTSPVFNPRVAVSHLLRGTGVEVGPGMNPFVQPGDGVNVTYVEALSIDQWKRNYLHGAEMRDIDHERWRNYVIGDAQQLDVCADGLLDFIFSSHVFEHLMNPLGVLENWSKRLKSGGVVACCLPDLRYCFDLRQPPSTEQDWLTEHETAMWTLTDKKYEKWCRYTAPYNTPENLIERNYSIHAHYYTPLSFRRFVEIVMDRRLFRRAFLNTSPNNKDFAFVLWK